MKYYVECGDVKKEVDAQHWTNALTKAFKGVPRKKLGILARFRSYKHRAWHYVAPENYRSK